MGRWTWKCSGGMDSGKGAASEKLIIIVYSYTLQANPGKWYHWCNQIITMTIHELYKTDNSMSLGVDHILGVVTLYHYHTTEDIHLSDFPTHFPSTKLSTGSQSLHEHDVTTQHQRTAEHTLYQYTYYRLHPKDIPALSSLIHTAITSQDASHPFQYHLCTTDLANNNRCRALWQLSQPHSGWQQPHHKCLSPSWVFHESHSALLHYYATIHGT